MKLNISRLTMMAAAALSLNLVACSEGKINTNTPVDTNWGIFAGNSLQILGADGQPLVNAKILIGTELNSFAGNFLTSDSNGQVTLPDGWTEAQPVTIEAPGYVRATYYNQEPGAHAYQLRKKPGVAQYEVKGVTQGHTVVDKDGLIDFGLVIPALTRADLLSFNLSSVISSQMDTISIVGQDADIPSNVTLPKQKETYLLPITIQKPTYRLYFGEPGVQKIFAARGRFPFKEVVDQLRKKVPFYEVINSFTINGGGVKDVAVAKSITEIDLSVTDLSFKNKVKVVAPKIGGDETLMVLGVAQMAEHLIPTDVKRLTSGQQMQLATLDQNGLVMSLLKKTADMDSDAVGSDRLSAVLIPALNAAPQFLPIPADPALAGNGDLLVPKMNSISGVHPVATYSLLSQVVEETQGKDKVSVNKPYWEIYAPEWLEVVSLPKWPEGDSINGKKHWEVNLLGSLNASQVKLGPAMINDTTHVTHTSIDF